MPCSSVIRLATTSANLVRLVISASLAFSPVYFRSAMRIVRDNLSPIVSLIFLPTYCPPLLCLLLL
jgi:hypothetical protein